MNKQAPEITATRVLLGYWKAQSFPILLIRAQANAFLMAS